MTNDKLWGYINRNLNSIKKLGIEIIKQEDNWGDRYHSEDSSEYTFRIFEDEYKVGYAYITEDDDDWYKENVIIMIGVLKTVNG